MHSGTLILQLEFIFKARQELGGQHSAPVNIATDNVRRDMNFVPELTRKYFPAAVAAAGGDPSKVTLLVQDILHRIFPIERYMDKDHPDYALARVDFQQVLRRFGKKDPGADSSYMHAAKGTEEKPVGASGAVPSVPASCRTVAGRAAVVEKLLGGHLITKDEVAFLRALIESYNMERSKLWEHVIVACPKITEASSNGGRRAPVPVLRRLCVKLGLDPNKYYSLDVGYENTGTFALELEMLVGFYKKPRWSSSEAKLDTAARVGRLLSQKARTAGASEQEVGGFRIAAPTAAEAAARKGICDRKHVDDFLRTTTDPVVMQGLINNQRFPKLSRGTLPNETVHSVLNAKGVGKGWKSYDLLNAYLEIQALKYNHGMLCVIIRHEALKYQHGDRQLIMRADALKMRARQLIHQAADPSEGRFWYGMDYMATFKGRRATRTTATDLIDRKFKVVAFDDVVWAPEELSVLEGSVKDYYENACITGTYGNLFRWVSQTRVTTRDSRAIARKVKEMERQLLGEAPAAVPEEADPSVAAEDAEDETELA